jgi:hypothetical protein
MTRPKHLFVSSCDGALHDTRDSNWSANPLRKIFSRTFSRINTVAEFKATLRAGQYAWPGGYPMFLICSDGAALHFDCAKENARQIMESIATKANDGWRVVGCDINYEDSELVCDHCSDRIESAYGD